MLRPLCLSRCLFTSEALPGDDLPLGLIQAFEACIFWPVILPSGLRNRCCSKGEPLSALQWAVYP